MTKVPTDAQWSDLASRVGAKQDTLTFDTTPTSASTNPVTSGGVYSAMKQSAIPYGVCDTAAATAAKTVTIDGITSLTTGLSIRVFFINALDVNYPTLNVNSLGAKAIRGAGSANSAASSWKGNEVLDLVYDGTYWRIVDGGLATTVYYGVTKLSSATNSTSTTLAATPSAVKTAYDLAASKATTDQAVGATEPYTIASSSWTALSSSDPYTYSATVTATYTIGSNTIVHLLNDQPVAFANYGFAVASVSGQTVTIYSIGKPSSSTTLKINYKEGA